MAALVDLGDCTCPPRSPNGSSGLEALRSLVGSTVDGQPEAWVLVAHMLPDFAGSVSELLFTAAAAAG